ncbi:MAG: S1 family peptidase, partial [Actinomycetota bacterium]|nr:S1 family peptidase [Actinomycetota bacterium]
MLGLGAAAATAALVLGSTTAATARPDDARLGSSGSTGAGEAAAALAREFGISTAAAKQRLQDERRQDRLADRVVAALGERRTGGAYIAPTTGDVVVTVTGAAAARDVRASGATARRVEHSSAGLDAVHERLDRFARRSGAGRVLGWYVDVRDNVVTVTAAAGADGRDTRQFLHEARSYGDRVEIERSQADAVPAAYLYGGQQVQMSSGGICSNGFNARTSSGAYILLTAGHCAQGSPTFSRNGVTIGGTRG